MKRLTLESKEMRQKIEDWANCLPVDWQLRVAEPSLMPFARECYEDILRVDVRDHQDSEYRLTYEAFCENPTYVSISSLARWEASTSGDKLFLVGSATNAETWKPFGGVAKFKGEAKAFLNRVGFKPKLDKNSSRRLNDLRGNIPSSNLPFFLAWLFTIENERESSLQALQRELIEELSTAKIAIAKQDYAPDLKFIYLWEFNEGFRWRPKRFTRENTGEWAFRFGWIFNINVADNRAAANLLNTAAGRSNPTVCVVTEDEARSLHRSGSAKQDLRGNVLHLLSPYADAPDRPRRRSVRKHIPSKVCFISHCWKHLGHKVALNLKQTLDATPGTGAWVDECDLQTASGKRASIIDAHSSTWGTIILLDRGWLNSEDCGFERDLIVEELRSNYRWTCIVRLDDVEPLPEFKDLIWIDLRGLVSKEGLPYSSKKDKFDERISTMINSIFGKSKS